MGYGPENRLVQADPCQPLFNPLPEMTMIHPTDSSSSKHAENSVTHLSIELVPRGKTELEEESALIKKRFPDIDLINIPDLTRFPLRAWEGCVVAKKHYPRAIPHIRALDINPDAPLPMMALLRENAIEEVLIVTGDPHTDPKVAQFEVNAVDIIKKFKREMPEIKVYAAVDPYRSGFQKESHYLLEKKEAGADGFFTQPFFDLRFMEIYAEILAGHEVFWGVSPVMTETSKAYWEKRNMVVFPKDFQPTLDWNTAFAKQAIQFAKEHHTHIYFMPILIDLVHYLEGVFSP